MSFMAKSHNPKRLDSKSRWASNPQSFLAGDEETTFTGSVGLSGSFSPDPTLFFFGVVDAMIAALYQISCL
jgi:hypothetical protein